MRWVNARNGWILNTSHGVQGLEVLAKGFWDLQPFHILKGFVQK